LSRQNCRVRGPHAAIVLKKTPRKSRTQNASPAILGAELAVATARKR